MMHDRFANTVFDADDLLRMRAFTALRLKSFLAVRDGWKWRIDAIGADGKQRPLLVGRYWLWFNAERVAAALSTAHNDGAWIGLGDSPTVTITGTIRAAYMTAINFDSGKRVVWLPRDQIRIVNDDAIELPEFLAMEKGLL